MNKEILVSVETEETRVAVIEDGELVEFYIERAVAQQVAGNIYKGKVENVLPGMQAAFVDIGLEKNAFLYVDDALPLGDGEDELSLEDAHDVSIKDVLRPGQEVIVQVVKEPIGTKGARVTRHVSLPGRYLVLMPMVDYVGVSRRIHDEQERNRLRSLGERLKRGSMGLIVRTAAEGCSEDDLAKDVEFLMRLWNRVQARAKSLQAPALLHKDLGLVFRVVRDIFSDEVSRLVVDSVHEYERILELLDVISPHLKDRVQLYTRKKQDLFEFYNVESELDRLTQRKIWLKCGGYIVVDQTEALTVIDVNTGKYVGTTTLADTVFKTNLEAAVEIARQVRLRDIGGIVIIDFIDMESAQRRQKVLEALQEALARDRTKAHVLGITHLGLVEMTRKKVRQSLDEILNKPCPYCSGKGRVMSEESMSLKVKREIKRILRNTSSEAILVEVNPAVASLLIGSGGINLRDLERETGKSIFIRGCEDCHIEEMNLRAVGRRDEIQARALPVKTGQVIELQVEEPHASNSWDGIARVHGYVIDIEGAGNKVGEKVKVQITKAFRTYAKAKLV